MKPRMECVLLSLHMILDMGFREELYCYCLINLVH
jgi:hypothetical protein